MSLSNTTSGDWRPAAVLTVGAVAATLIWGCDSRYEDWEKIDSVLVGVIASFAHTVGRVR